MAAANRSPWSVPSMLSAACEVAIASLLLLQMALAFIVLQLMKRFTPIRICSDPTIGHHHVLFRFGPFSLLGDFVTNLPTRKQLLHLSHDEATTSKQGRNLFPIKNQNNRPCPSLKGKEELGSCTSAAASSTSGNSSDSSEFKFCDMTAGLSSHGVSTGTSLVYRRKGSKGKRKCQPMLPGDTRSWSEELVEEEDEEEDDDDDETSIRFLNQQTTFTWKCRLHQREASYGSLLDSQADPEHSICPQGHCCGTVLKMKKTLEIGRQHLHNIYTELEEERDAAETAANEAMAMILKLQEEKCSLRLETDHYRRMAEEKAFYDERAIQNLEEDLCKKENECLLLEEELNELKKNVMMRIHEQEENAPYFTSISKQLSHSEASCLKEEKAMGNAAPHKRWNLTLVAGDSPTIREPNKRTSYDMDELSFGYSAEDEKVVNIDEANMDYKTSWEAQMLLSPQDIFEVQDGRKEAMVKPLQQSEAQEEEKYVDITNNLKGSYRTSLQSPISCLSDTSSQAYEEGNWKTKLVTLEDIDSRLRFVESKTLLSREKSLSSDDEHMTMILLKEILQELQLILRAKQT